MQVTSSDCKYNINCNFFSCKQKILPSNYDIFFKGKISDEDYLRYDFVKPEHVSFFRTFVSQYPKISEDSIISKLNRISKMDRLEPFSKMNLVEHVLVKESRGEKRDFDTLISNIEYFSANENISPILVSDSAKYILENPEVDKEKFNSALTFVSQNASFNSPSVLMKVSKLILASDEKKEPVLKQLVQRGFSSEQIAFVAGMSQQLFEKLQGVDDALKLPLDLQFEYFQYLSNANDKIYNAKMKTIFPSFPITKQASNEECKKLERMFSASSPLKIEDINDLKVIRRNSSFSEDDALVFNICQSILKNNVPKQGVSPKQYYAQKSFQSIAALEGLNLTLEQRNKIAKIIKASGEFLDTTSGFSPENLALTLRYKNSFDIFKALNESTSDKSKIDIIESLNNFLKSNTNCLVQDDFNRDEYQIIHFEDGTVNKIIEYNEQKKHNPQIMIHAAGIDVSGLLPLEKSKDDMFKLYNSNANRIFSTSFVSSDDFKPFRDYGFVLTSESDDVLGGLDCDLASGYDKTVGKFDVDCLKNSPNIFSYLPDKIKAKYHLNDYLYRGLADSASNGDVIAGKMIQSAQKAIGATERIDGRKYNEFYMYNPTISAIYVYGDIQELPFEFRKFAQDNDLKILHLKSRLTQKY